jgi:hypothetical protein
MASPRLFGGSMAAASRLTIKIAEEERALVTTDSEGNVGAQILIPLQNNKTRLLFRDRAGKGDAPFVADAFRWLIWDPMHFVMQHRMMLGIKERAEGELHEPAFAYGAAKVGWILAGAGISTSLLVRRKLWPWLVLPVLAGLPAAVFTGDLNAALAGFIATGISVTGALYFGRLWWPPFLVLASLVLLTLVLAPDAYLAFGLIFLVVVAVVAGLLSIFRARSSSGRRTHAPGEATG